MHRTLYLSAAALAALSLAACNRPAADTTAATGSTAAGTAVLEANQPVNAAQDATGAAVGAVSAATVGAHDTGAFVSNASQSDMYEIAAAKIAQSRSKNAEVKAFAKMMAAEHTAMSNEMAPLVKAAGKAPATELDQRRNGFLDNLKQATDANFDKAYIDQQVNAHEEALTLVKGYADAGDDAGLKAGAAKAAPKVQMHLDKAKAIQASLK